MTGAETFDQIAVSPRTKFVLSAGTIATILAGGLYLSSLMHSAEYRLKALEDDISEIKANTKDRYTKQDADRDRDTASVHIEGHSRDISDLKTRIRKLEDFRLRYLTESERGEAR